MARNELPVLRAGTIFVLVICINIHVIESVKPRNVIILLADDAGFEFGAYMNKICQTPHIDALAQNSVIFNNAFNSVSSCSPSRASLLSGKPSHQNGMYGLHNSVHHFNSFNNVTSLPNLLRKHDIYTGIVGKKHVGPAATYKFDYEQTEEHHHTNQVGRNITFMKHLVRDFLNNANAMNKSFLLYVGFHDPHRCRPELGLGSFCERWGSGQQGYGTIPDWQPWYYQWDEIQLPYYIQDTEEARRDISAQYTTISRLDQGVGLILSELQSAGRSADTLVVFTSDNGPPVPSGRTSLYDPGLRAPLLISSPLPEHRRHTTSGAMVSHLDLFPTVLDWFDIDQDSDNEITPAPDRPRSLLPILEKEPPVDPNEAVFASQTLHEVTMYYPMRVVRSRRYKLIHNLVPEVPFPVDQDLFESPTFQDLVNRTRSRQPLYWYRTIDGYFHRSEWELYDLERDPEELNNLHGASNISDIEQALRTRLEQWMRDTADPWRCGPHAVLIRGDCQPLYIDTGTHI